MASEGDRAGAGKGHGPNKPRIKQAVIEERGHMNLKLEGEEHAKFDYRP